MGGTLSKPSFSNGRTLLSSTVIVWGIPNCDSVKQMRAALTEAGWTVDFRDFKKLGVPADRLTAWMAATGWPALLNRQGTTWRKLDTALQHVCANFVPEEYGKVRCACACACCAYCACCP